jgi:hypothetical protein
MSKSLFDSTHKSIEVTILGTANIYDVIGEFTLNDIQLYVHVIFQYATFSAAFV